MEPDYILAGDPGGSGAVVRIDKDRRILVCRLSGKGPVEERRRTWDWHIRANLGIQEHHTVKVFMERVHAIRGDYIDRLASMMRSAGYLEAILDRYTSEPITFMDCSDWQYFHRLRGVPEKEKHKIYQQKATEIFKVNYPQDAATAILIANYAWFQQWGKDYL